MSKPRIGITASSHEKNLLSTRSGGDDHLSSSAPSEELEGLLTGSGSSILSSPGGSGTSIPSSGVEEDAIVPDDGYFAYEKIDWIPSSIGGRCSDFWPPNESSIGGPARQAEQPPPSLISYEDAAFLPKEQDKPKNALLLELDEYTVVPGQMLTGTLKLDIERGVKIRALHVGIKGVELCSWTRWYPATTRGGGGPAATDGNPNDVWSTPTGDIAPVDQYRLGVRRIFCAGLGAVDGTVGTR